MKSTTPSTPPVATTVTAVSPLVTSNTEIVLNGRGLFHIVF